MRLSTLNRLTYFFTLLALGGMALTAIHTSANLPSQIETFSDVEDWELQKRFILSDSKARINDDLSIHSELYQRVSFWFDVYSRYEGHYKIIHHNLYPWVVYEIVDTSKMADPDRYMQLKMEWYSLLFEGMAKKNGHFTDEEKYYLNLFAQTPDPDRALQTAAKKIRYQTGQRDAIAQGLERAQPFLDHMEEIFAEKDLPVELTRLTLVESSFDPNVYSRVGAAGVWQFMRRTGRKFLKINGKIDERLSPLKSTEAAAKLLKQNHKILYGQWPLAITAYNYGPSGLRRAVREHGSTDLHDIIDSHKDDRFSFASANFYACFLAVLYAEKYRDFIFPRVRREPSPNLSQLATTHPLRAKEILATYRVKEEQFLTYNPDFGQALDRNILLPAKTRYYLPMEAIDELAVND